MAAGKRIKGKQLYKLLFFGTIVMVLAIGVLAFWGVREVRRDAAKVAVESSVRGLSGAVTVLVNAVTSSNDEIGTKVLGSLKLEALRASFSKVLNKHSNLVAVMVSNGEGLQYSLSRRPNGLMEAVPDQANRSSMLLTFVRPDGVTVKENKGTHFDRGAADTVLADEFNHLKPGQVNWRSAARFHDAGESWLTASSLVASDGENYMVSYVFPVSSFVNQLGGAEKGGAEKVFLYWGNDKVLAVEASADHTGLIDNGQDVQSQGTVSDPVISAATDLLSVETNRKAPFSFKVDGEVWWAYVSPLSVFGDTMSLGVAVPRKNIVSTLTSDTFLQGFGGFLVLVAGVALFFIHKNRIRIEAIGLRHNAVKTPEDILHLIAEGESRTLEFKQTLRFNLKSGKNGREIEHASMKTVAGFLNSEGGTLFVGVADSGEITGFEEDKLGNDDKALLHFNNLVNQHIGTEFSQYLDTAVIEVQGKHVLRAYCLPAAVPAILKNGSSEEFYIRSGPASRQLTLSQFYEWVQNH